jgi:predicted nuclease with RNAse H fold
VTWAGIDVGAAKGFDAVALDCRGLVAGPVRLKTSEAVLDWLRTVRPCGVAVDAPRQAAPPGERLRLGERELRRAVCGIRWTPDRRALEARPGYYGWILHGLCLYDELARHGFAAVECFPTAAWTRWAGPRGRRSRAAWSRAALAQLRLEGIPARTSQDARDAIAAALTARLHDEGRTECFGTIVVPSGL